MNNRLLIGITPVLLCLASCTSTSSANLPTVSDMLRDATAQNGRACVRQSDIRGWGSLDNNVISIDARRNYYLATLMPGCHSVETSMAALFRGNFGEICGGGMDKVTLRDDSCQIRQMYEFEDRESAFALYDQVIEQRAKLKEQAEQAN